MSKPAVNPWAVAFAVVIPTFMEILDTSIANVALRYIAGGLSASNNDAEWVITSYLAANAAILPLTGWIAAHFGRRNYFLLSIAVFTLASVLCGTATSLLELILFRALQGVAGGGLQPMTQGILLDSFPPEKQGSAQALFGVAALIGPVVGPALGGWLTTAYDWRWIFFINLPVGLIALVYCAAVVHDTPEMEAERAKLRKKPLNFDYIGVGLLVIIMASWETMLSKGQQWDWVGDPFWRVQTLMAICVFGLIALVIQEFRHSSPVVNFRPLGERNFALGCLMIFCVYGCLYASNTSLPRITQSLFNYDALQSGLLQTPAGACAIIPMIGGGYLLGKGVDARLLIAAGMLVLVGGQLGLGRATPDVSPNFFMACQVVSIFGLSMSFASLSVVAYKYVPPHLRGAAVGLYSLLRNEGGSVGTSVAQTLEERRTQMHLSRLSDTLTPFDPAVQQFVQATTQQNLARTGDPALARQQALQMLDDLRQTQASLLASTDIFILCAALAGVLLLLVFLLKPAKSEGGPVAAE